MNKCKEYLFCILLFCFLLPVYSQKDAVRPARMEDGKLVLRVNLDWEEAQKAIWAGQYSLDSVFVEALFRRDYSWINDSTAWFVSSADNQWVELTKELGEPANLRLDKVLLTSYTEVTGLPAPEPLFGIYGRNDFINDKSFHYEESEEKGCFVLRGYEQAQRVALAGSFNQWNTMQIPMQQTDSGWVACVQLLPGKHLYRFIADGRWIHDPGNRIRENDGRRRHNSVVFAPNYHFILPGYAEAHRVFVSGSFNGWNPREIPMNRMGDGWEISMYLRPGTHNYKFVVDGNWINDPTHTNARPDGAGNFNSVLAIGDTTWFVLESFEHAQKVVLSGSFNAWNTAELEMEQTPEGWVLPYVLAPGNYEYKFIVDGQWITDPGNPFEMGSGEFTNSVFINEPNYLFVLKGFEEATTVLITGSFNGWNTHEYRMVFRDGEWVFPIRLQQGRYSYKFVVDGTWLIDPENPLVERNEFNDFNSVLWIR